MKFCAGKSSFGSMPYEKPASAIANVLIYFMVVFTASLLLNKVFDFFFTKVEDIKLELPLTLLFEIIVEFTILIMVFEFILTKVRARMLNDVSYEMYDAFVLSFAVFATQTNLTTKMTRFTELF